MKVLKQAGNNISFSELFKEFACKPNWKSYNNTGNYKKGSRSGWQNLKNKNRKCCKAKIDLRFFVCRPSLKKGLGGWMAKIWSKCPLLSCTQRDCGLGDPGPRNIESTGHCVADSDGNFWKSPGITWTENQCKHWNKIVAETGWKQKYKFEKVLLWQFFWESVTWKSPNFSLNDPIVSNILSNILSVLSLQIFLKQHTHFGWFGMF